LRNNQTGKKTETKRKSCVNIILLCVQKTIQQFNDFIQDTAMAIVAIETTLPVGTAAKRNDLPPNRKRSAKIALPTGVNFYPRDIISALQSNGNHHSCHLKEGSGGKTKMKRGEPRRHGGYDLGDQAPVPRSGQP
jgi:hypothetical protein